MVDVSNLQQEGVAVGLDPREAIAGARQASAAFDRVGRSARKTKGPLGEMRGAFLGLRTAATALSAYLGISMVRQFASLERGLNILEVRLGATSTQMEALEGLSKQLGSTTEFTTQQIVQGMIGMAQAGKSFQQIMALTAPTLALARAEGLQFAQAADILQGTMATFNIAMEEGAETADFLFAVFNSGATTAQQFAVAMRSMGPAAAVNNVALEELAATYLVLRQRQIPAMTAGDRMRSIILNLVAPTETAKTAFRDFGIQLREVNPQVVTLQQALQRMIDAGLGSQELARIFPREDQAIVKALMESYNEIAENLEKIAGNGGSLDKFNDKISKDTQARLDRLASAWQALTTSMGEFLSETVGPLMERWAKTLGFIAEQWQQIGRAMYNALVVMRAIAGVGIQGEDDPVLAGQLTVTTQRQLADAYNELREAQTRGGDITAGAGGFSLDQINRFAAAVNLPEILEEAADNTNKLNNEFEQTQSIWSNLSREWQQAGDALVSLFDRLIFQQGTFREALEQTTQELIRQLLLSRLQALANAGAGALSNIGGGGGNGTSGATGAGGIGPGGGDLNFQQAKGAQVQINNNFNLSPVGGGSAAKTARQASRWHNGGA